MGKKWDSVSSHLQMQEWHKEWLTQAFRVLKPGGVIKAFSAARTYHRLLAAMEEVGFQDLQVESWVYAQGMPKSHNVSKALDKLAGETSKIVGYSDPRSKYDDCVRNSTGQGNEYGSLTNKGVVAVTEPVSDMAIKYKGYGTGIKPCFEPFCVGVKPFSNKGRILWVSEDQWEEVSNRD